MGDGENELTLRLHHMPISHNPAQAEERTRRGENKGTGEEEGRRGGREEGRREEGGREEGMLILNVMFINSTPTHSSVLFPFIPAIKDN